MEKITKVYTDGGCSGNPGTGGYGVVVLENGTEAEYSQGYSNTTNNRMEVMAVICALKETKGNIRIISDSTYAINGAKGKSKRKANMDLWEEYDRLKKGRKIEFEWVKGHSGNYYNERCDEICGLAIKSNQKIVDQGYLDQKLEPAKAVVKEPTEKRVQKAHKDRILPPKPNIKAVNWKNITAEEYAEKYGVNPKCAEKIIEIRLSKGTKLDELRTNGPDEWTRVYKSELVKIIGEEAKNRIYKAIEVEEYAFQAMRWMCRGLNENEAIETARIAMEKYSDNYNPKR